MNNKTTVTVKQLTEYLSKMPDEQSIELRSMVDPISYALEMHIIFPMERSTK